MPAQSTIGVFATVEERLAPKEKEEASDDDASDEAVSFPAAPPNPQVCRHCAQRARSRDSGPIATGRPYQLGPAMSFRKHALRATRLD
jgi:hypothetical protein